MNADTPRPAERVASIDILRALTMILMIVVNDLWTLKNAPSWLGHAERGVDGMGVADAVYPAFLFLVGLSLPHAVEARRRKGHAAPRLLWHVLLRSLALIVMGLFLVNGETLDAHATGMPRYLWNLLCCAAFILVWHARGDRFPLSWSRVLRCLGVAGLVALAWVYRGNPDEGTVHFSQQWWGILGQIGWAYLVSGAVTVFARGKPSVVLVAWILFAGISVLSKMGLLPHVIASLPRPIGAGTLTALTLGGVLVGTLFKRWRGDGDNRRIFVMFAGLSVLWLGLYAVTRPPWGLSKLGQTPAWLFLCSALTLLAFLAVYWLADVKRKAAWFRPIRPAGAQTLLCYLVPYLCYGMQHATNVWWPEWLSTGWVGVGKSAVFALLCTGCAGLLARAGVRLRL